ncbi:MAG: hypothetical protein ACE3L7_08840 [Candidatus Pristimantibacillus sp.]
MSQRLKEMISLLTGLLILTISLIWVLQLWNADLTIPFGYSGDSLSASMTIKTVMDYGWYITNPSLGAPFELNMNDYPLGGDNFNYLLIKFIALFSNNYAVVVNVFHILTYYLAFLTAYVVFRYLKIHVVFAIGGSLLFSLMPYHFFRGMGGHLFLICYFIIPFVFLVAYWIMNNKIQSLPLKTFHENRSRNIFSLITAILIGSTGIYYAFFAGFFWAVTAIYTFINKKDKKAIYTSGILIVTILITLITNYSPTILYKIKYGANEEAVQRSVIETEILSLKINQIFMPMLGHRVGELNAIAEKYSMISPLFNENHSVSLGILGSIGFIMLLAFLFVKTRLKDRYLSIIQDMSILNISAILLSMTGGIGFFVAVFLTSSIRGYNRIIPYIGFISFLSVIIIFQIIYMKIKSKKVSYLYLLIVGMIFIVGVLDQTSTRYIPNYTVAKEEFMSDKQYFKSIEESIPSDSMIFQLPYVPFPEHPWVNRMGNYEHLKGYLHTSSLRWSFGALNGSLADLWTREVSAKPAEEMLEALSLAKFEGIYLDRFGYPDNDTTVEDEIVSITKAEPLVSKNERWVFIDLKEYNEIIRKKYSEEKYIEMSEKAIHPLNVGWGEGIYDQENSPDSTNYWRWLNKRGVIYLNNTSEQPKKIHLEANFVAGDANEATLSIKSSFIKENILINQQGVNFEKNFILPPGKHELVLQTSGDKMYAPNDPRELYFRIEKYVIKEVEKEVYR